MGCPPAAFIAAVDPVAVHTHIPDDQTLNHSRADAPGEHMRQSIRTRIDSCGNYVDGFAAPEENGQSKIADL